MHLKIPSEVVQWLRLHIPNVGGTGLIPSQETNILHATWYLKKTFLSILRVGGYFLNAYFLKLRKGIFKRLNNINLSQ